MERKTIGIIDYYLSDILVIKEQLNSVFNDAVKIICIPYGTEKDSVFQVDMLLYASFNLYSKMKHLFDGKEKPLKMNRTISQEGKVNLTQVKKHSKAYVYHEDEDIAKEMCRKFHHIMNCTQVNMQPISKIYNNASRKVYLVHNQNYNDELYDRLTFIDVGKLYLDVDSIVEISMFFDLDYLTENINLYHTIEAIETNNKGLEYIVNKMNSFQSKVNVFMNTSEKGVIEIDKMGKIVRCNQSAERILKKSKEDLCGVDANYFFPKPLIEKSICNHRGIENEIFNINGQSIIISVEIMSHSEKYYGALIFIRKFDDSEKLQHTLRKKVMGKGHKAKYKFDDIIGSSEEIEKCKKVALRMSKSTASVLITGETGTGKELFAQAIHNASGRKNFQFVAINCAALPPNILETELFGYEEGAFTGSKKGGKIGLFEMAHQGTIFLDEIAELPYPLQTKLLRVLQEKEIRRVGSDRVIAIDCRVIAATNQDLQKQMSYRKFREDLYYRLSVLPLEVPPLRFRGNDIFEIINYFKVKQNSDIAFSKEALLTIRQHPWNGNVRELQNFMIYLDNLEKTIIEKEDLLFGKQTVSHLKVEAKTQEKETNKLKNTPPYVHHDSTEKEKKYLVLNLLYDAYKQGKRAGRRSLSQKAKEKGYFISEQEIRLLMIQLEKETFVNILKGRAGTVITQEGIHFCEECSI